MTIQFDVRRAIGRRQPAVRRAQVALDLQVLKDSNFFCPQDTGDLQNAGIRGTVPGSGVVTWASVYAKRQYHEFPKKSHDKNPNARMKWADEAKAIHLEEWRQIAQDGLHG